MIYLFSSVFSSDLVSVLPVSFLSSSSSFSMITGAYTSSSPDFTALLNSLASTKAFLNLAASKYI